MFLFKPHRFSLSCFIISHSSWFGCFVKISLISRLCHYLIMDSQVDLPLYASIIEGNIDIDSPFLGASQNNPKLVLNSSPEVETITEKANWKEKASEKNVGEYLVNKMKYIEESQEQEKESLHIKAKRVRLEELRDRERIRLEERRILMDEERISIWIFCGLHW